LIANGYDSCLHDVASKFLIKVHVFLGLAETVVGLCCGEGIVHCLINNYFVLRHLVVGAVCNTKKLKVLG